MREAEEPAASGEEVARVLKQVEADVVRVQHAPQEVVAHGEGAEDLGGNTHTMHGGKHTRVVRTRDSGLTSDEGKGVWRKKPMFDDFTRSWARKEGRRRRG